MSKTVFFTGHRPAGLGFKLTAVGASGKAYYPNRYNAKSYERFIEQVADFLSNMYPDGTNFMTGGAQGFDQLAFRAIELCKARGRQFRNVLCIPFEGYDARWSKYGIFSQDDCDKMRRQADEVHVVTKGTLTDRQKIGALMARNHYMADRSQECVAVLLGDKNGPGGTAECVRYCDSHGIHVTFLETKIETEGNLERLVMKGAWG